jgi:hypothetical protein
MPFIPPHTDPTDTNPLHTHFRAWGAYCREHGDFLAGAELGDGPARSLGFACPNCDQDRWFVVEEPDDDELTAQYYCRCCGFMWPMWRS